MMKTAPESRKQKAGIAKVVAITALAIFNLAAVTVGTYAWFSTSLARANLDTVAGDLNLDIKKVTAYKKVYPYYRNSADIVNYEESPRMKGYVIEDENYASSASFATSVTISLGSPTNKSYNPTGTGNRSTFLYTSGENFKYYLIGDSTFTGTTGEWSDTSGVASPRSSAIGVGEPAIFQNVVISVGAEFALLNVYAANKETHKVDYLNYSSISSISPGGRESPFEIAEDHGTLRCLKSGIYTISYEPSSITITQHNKNNDAIIGNNLLDQTLISLTYYGGNVDYDDYPEIEDYISTAVLDQNTMTILDVELRFKNASEVVAGLNINRLDSSAFDYSDTSSYTTYPYDSLRASDFFAFYAVLRDTPFADADAIWTAMHQPTDLEIDSKAAFSKFNGVGNTIPCTIHPNGIASAIIPPSTGESTTYHCYIGIEYDYEHINFFLNNKRLANSYQLDRDFWFYFTATQIEEEAISA